MFEGRNEKRCENCLARRGRPCPAWIAPGIMMKQDGTGEEKPLEGCFFQVMPWLVLDAGRLARSAAQSAQRGRNETQEFFGALINAIATATNKKAEPGAVPGPALIGGPEPGAG